MKLSVPPLPGRLSGIEIDLYEHVVHYRDTFGKTSMTIISWALLVVGAAAATARSDDAGRGDVRPESKLWIEGGSNVHSWSCKATTFESHVDVDSVDAPSNESSAGAERVRRVGVKIAVRNLKCGNGRMESDLYRALKASDPSIPSSIVGVFEALRAPAKDESHIDTEGTIAVAGVEKAVRLRITMERSADGTVVARGSVPLRMTDFGVTPPTGLFGLIRSHDEVVVRFEVVIAKRAGLVASR